MLRGRDRHHVFTRQIEFARANGNQAARKPATVEPSKRLENPLDRFDVALGEINDGRFHFHHPPPRHINREGAM